jgi:hypothetical protein
MNTQTFIARITHPKTLAGRLRTGCTTSLLPLLLLLALPAAVEAQFSYVINGGAITITGFGRDYGFPPYPVNMNIPSTIDGLPVTSIGDWAFWDIALSPPCGNMNNLRDVAIPDSVTNIGNGAFYESIGLYSVTIGNGVTRIGDEAFYGCGGLNRVVFGGNAPSLGTNVFDGDYGATVYYLPGTTGWGPTFGGLPTALWNLEDQFDCTTNNGAVTITGFNGPGSAVIIPDTINGLPVTSIGDGAFDYSAGLSSVTMGNGITSIGAFAFLGCSNLISITVSSRVTNIADLTFQNCIGLAHVAIPDGVTTIGANAFSGCISLTDVTIPDSVTNIADWAFESCVGLTSLTIGNGVTSIGRWAFDHCLSLTNVTIPNSVTTIGDDAFGNCTLLTNVTIGDHVSRIGEYAFDWCPNLANIVIPDSVTHIDVGAFSGCINLTNVTIGNSVTTIGYDAFAGCWHLARIIIPDSVNSIEGWAFSGCPSLTSVTFMGNRVTNIPWGTFAGCSHLTSILIPDSVRSIGDEAFSGSSLTNLIIPDSVTNIGDKAFWVCTSLIGIYFLGNAPSLGGPAVFSGDTNVTVYYLPGTVGWGTTFGGRPTALWFLPNPLILTSGPGFGVQSNAFGFIISWATNLPVVVEACTNPANHSWSPVKTNALTGGWSYFSDPQWANYPVRFYRVRWP